MAEVSVSRSEISSPIRSVWALPDVPTKKVPSGWMREMERAFSRPCASTSQREPALPHLRASSADAEGARTQSRQSATRPRTMGLPPFERDDDGAVFPGHVLA